MFNTPSFHIADAGIDPTAVARSARDLTLPDAGEFLRRMDVPAHVDAAIEAASEAARDVIERLPGQRRRRRRLPILVAVVSVGVLAAVGVATWLMRRRTAADEARDRVEDMEFDRGALDRTADKGVSLVPGTGDALPHSKGEVLEPTAISDLAESTAPVGSAITQSTATGTRRSTEMTDEHVKGTVSKVEGKVEEVAGKVTGNKGQEIHGKAKQVQGSAQEGLGDLQDAINKPNKDKT